MGAIMKFGEFFKDLKAFLSFDEKERGKSVKDDILLRIEGHPKMELIRDGLVIQTFEEHNIVTQRASVFMQKLMMMQADTYGVTHIALGIGDPHGLILDNLNNGLPWECDAPPDAPSTGGRNDIDSNKPILVNELARKKIDTKHYLNEDGTVSSVPTYIAEYKTLFLEREANGPIMEFGLVGGDVYPNEVDYIGSYQVDGDGVLLKDGDGHFIPVEATDPNRLMNVGDLITYKTHKLFYKTHEDRLRMTYKVKILLNDAPPEPAAE